MGLVGDLLQPGVPGWARLGRFGVRGSADAGSREDIALDLPAAQHGGGPCFDNYGSGRPVPPVSVRAALSSGLAQCHLRG
ncbi:hypothetical protein [Streptomyces sp. NPDC001435]|uniref:hypothetical protein n=1 Tax=unclassified Streptomyces TaxID=2593676 RepID=UPI0036A27EAB